MKQEIDKNLGYILLSFGISFLITLFYFLIIAGGYFFIYLGKDHSVLYYFLNTPDWGKGIIYFWGVLFFLISIVTCLGYFFDW